MEWDQEALELVKARVPRTVGMGLFVEATSLDKLDVFKLEELPGWLLCTTAVKDEIRSHQFSNIDFFEVGEILEK